MSAAESQTIKLVDPSRQVLAIAHVADEGDHLGGTIDLCCTPPSMRALFEEFEEIVNGQIFSLLAEIQEKIDLLGIKAVLDDGREVFVKNLQVFPSTVAVSLELAEVLAPSIRSA